MTVKEIKESIETLNDEQEILFKSESGLEWEILPKDKALLAIDEKYKKKAKIYLTVK